MVKIGIAMVDRMSSCASVSHEVLTVRLNGHYWPVISIARSARDG